MGADRGENNGLESQALGPRDLPEPAGFREKGHADPECTHVGLDLLPEPWPFLTASSFVLLAEGFVRRKKISLWFVGSLLVLSVFILTIGLAATTRAENVTVGGYYPGIIVSDVVRGRRAGRWAPQIAVGGGDILCSSSTEPEV